MKTSNKILIAFAAALILIPILGMVYVSRVYYKEGSVKDEVALHQVDNFNTPTPNMISIPIGNPFQSLEIADAKNMRLNIVLVKDTKFGIKVPKDIRVLLKTVVAENGKLVISVDQKADVLNRHVTIYVYAPTVTALTVGKADNLSLNASSDSLMLNLKDNGHVYFTDNSKLKKLTINASDVEKITVEDNKAESLSLTLNNTDFATERSSYTTLNISTIGKCALEVYGGNEEEHKYSIQNFVVNTVGNTNVELKNIKVVNCSGSFSDETIVNMPAANLNQMFKK